MDNNRKTVGLIAGKSGLTIINRLKNFDYNIILLCGSKNDSGYGYATRSKAIKFNPNDDALQIIEAINFFESNNIQGLILGTGTWFAIKILIHFEKVNIPVSHEPISSSLLKDKTKTKSKFLELDMPTPDHRTLYSKEASIQYFKDSNGAKVVKSNIDLLPVKCFKNSQSMVKYFSEIDYKIFSKGVLIENYIDGNDVTVPVFVNKTGDINYKGIVYWSKQTNYKLEGFDDLKNYELTIIQEKEIKRHIFNFIKKIGYFGVCRFDIRVAANSYEFLEVNSIISIRKEGSSYKACTDRGIFLDKEAIETYLENIS